MYQYKNQKQSGRPRKQTYSYQRGQGAGEGQVRNMEVVGTHYFISLSKEFLNLCVYCGVCCLPFLQNRRK